MRWLRPLAAVLLILALSGAPAIAQTTFPIIGPSGIVTYSTASVSCFNSTAACTIFTYTVPAGLISTSSNTNVTPPVNTPPPLHLTLRGILSTTSVGQTGAINVGANFGGSTATIAMLNAYTPDRPGAIGNAPIQFDVWVVPFATAIGANTLKLSGRVAYADTASETTINSRVVGTTALNASQTLAVIWQWGSAAQVNSLTIENMTLQIGN